MPQPRLLQTTEIAAFLARNPATAARVAVTRSVMAAGLYDFNIYDTVAAGDFMLKFPGVIEPRGIQVQDSFYGLVTIEPTPSGIYFSGWTAPMGDVDKQNYESPTGNNPLADLEHLVMMLAAGGAFLYLAGKALEGRRG